MSCLPPIGRFNLAGIGHYYFFVTGLDAAFCLSMDKETKLTLDLGFKDLVQRMRRYNHSYAKEQIQKIRKPRTRKHK